MRAEELYAIIGNYTTPDMEVMIEVGGDGAIHTGTVKNVVTDRDKNTVTISSEAE